MSELRDVACAICGKYKATELCWECNVPACLRCCKITIKWCGTSESYGGGLTGSMLALKSCKYHDSNPNKQAVDFA